MRHAPTQASSGDAPVAGGDLVISTNGDGLALADGGFAGARTVSAALALGIITLASGKPCDG